MTIRWWVVLGSTLWVGGLAVELAALSVAHYLAQEDGSHLRNKLSEPGLLRPLYGGLALFCTGLVLVSPAWWLRVPAGLLSVFFWTESIRGARRRQLSAAAVTVDKPDAGAGPRRDRWLGWGLLLAGLLLLAGWGLVTGLQLQPHVRSLQAHLAALQEFAPVGAGNTADELWDAAALEAAGRHLAGIQTSLAAIERRIGPLLPLGRLLRWVPGRGGDLAIAAELLELARHVSAAGEQALEALSPTLEATDGSPTRREPLGATLPEILPLLETARPALEAAQGELATARDIRSHLRANRLSPQVAGGLARLDDLLPALEGAVDGALLLPGLLGAEGPRTYLVLVQNRDELRATGGFVSGVGELHLEDGRLTLSRFDDSYAVDNLSVPHELAPPDLQATLYGDLWLFRDSNWDVDFRVSARRAIEIYARDRGVEADGVLALDLATLEALLDALGPLEVEGSTEPVTAENVERVIQAGWDRSAVEGEGKWWLHRKDLMGEIASAAISRLVAGPGMRLAELAGTLGRALREKHLLVYASEASAARLLRHQNWDGALRIPGQPSDRLLVVDSNVGFNKADAHVVRFVDYWVDLSATSKPHARLVLTYRHQGAAANGPCLQEARYGDTYRDMMERCYWDYVRVHVPAGSRLLAGPDLSLPRGSLAAREGALPPQTPLRPTMQDEGWLAWGEFFDLAPGAERTLSFEYELPSGLLEMDASGLVYYRLLVQKQPGTEAVPLRLQIRLPAGAEVVGAEPTDLAPELVVVTDLRMDRQFELVFRWQ